jgi:Uma2 family endonuclease
MSTATLPQIEMTVEELAARVGPVPLWRVRTDPSPGTATEEDVERIRREEGRLCEIIDGVLVEKAVSTTTAFLAMEIGAILRNFVVAARLGWVLGADGFVWLLGTHLRAPDVSFFRRDQMPGGELPETGYADVAPALAVEVVSPGNTPREMEQKREIFFAAGTELFWIVFPDRREVEVWSDPRMHRVLGDDDVIDGGNVLPGFSVPVAQLFANLNVSESEQ